MGCPGRRLPRRRRRSGAGRAATIVGTSAGEVIHGTDHADVIVGLGGNDTIVGRGGADWVCGSAGSDRLSGGGGHDHLFGGIDAVHVTDEGSTERVGDALAGGAGNDRLAPGRDARTADEVIHDSISWASSARGVHVDVAAGRATGQGRDVFRRGTTWMVGSPSPTCWRAAHALTCSAAGAVRTGSSVTVATIGSSRTRAARTAPAPRMSRSVAQGTTRSAPRGAVTFSRAGRVTTPSTTPGRPRSACTADGERISSTSSSPTTPVAPRWSTAGRVRADFVDLHTQAINPATLPSTATWDLATGKLVFELDEPVISQVGHFERVDLSAWGTTWTVRGTTNDDDLTASGSWGTTFTALGGDDTFWGSSYDDTFAGGLGTDHSRGMGDGTDTCSSVELMDEADCEIVTP